MILSRKGWVDFMINFMHSDSGILCNVKANAWIWRLEFR